MEPGGRAPFQTDAYGRDSGGSGHVFTLYVANQDPGGAQQDSPAVAAQPLAFLRSDEEGPSGP